jgi:hypothetical protein
MLKADGLLLIAELQLRDSAGLLTRVTGFAIKPSHPGARYLDRVLVDNVLNVLYTMSVRTNVTILDMIFPH